ncbi:MAG: mechanosensitive ion channel protein MscS [Leptolyngbya foveolarum]|uniref:Mechanosensitive ion channel protein MscS n=1 Tax=Leptolyngbya foveolarum TaxID=47253 RepID=A0A2W4UDJ1_9CYAN|nr:MAG: mechanosensitive ion channel protein MscS [Leptolyngbya foveolarum]
MNRKPSDRLGQKQSAKHSNINRLIIGAVLSFSLAIALPFIAPFVLFPASLSASSDSAPVILDGRPVFRVTDTADAGAATRALIISNSLQQFADQSVTPDIQIEELTPDGLTTVSLQTPPGEEPDLQASFTVTPEDTGGVIPESQAQVWAETLRGQFSLAKTQRQRDYVRQNSWQLAAVPIIAAIAYWMSGLFWREYLFKALRLATSSSADSEKIEKKASPFTAANLFLNATLLLLRLGIGTSAVLYITNLFPETREKSHRIISRLADIFTGNNIPLGNNPISILDTFRALLLVLLVFLFAQIIASAIKRRVLHETGINRGVQEAIAVLLRYGLIFVGTLIVLQTSGINISSLTIVISALGVGAGLGLQNIVKDVSSGLVLVFERPVQVGEFVEIGKQAGTVERIGARSSEIRTLDQVSIIVPNSQFLEQEVVNWSHRNPISRLRIPVGVSYKADPEEVRNLLIKTGNAHEDVLVTPPPQVLFCSLGDSAFEFELLVWVAQPSRQFIIKSDLLFMLTKAFYQNGIEIPYPQRDIHIISGTPPTNGVST